MSEALEQVVEAIRQGQSFLVTAHPGPDGDAIGSTVAALLGLQLLGRKVWAYNPDPVPDKLAFLQGAGQIKAKLPRRPVDVTLVLDCSDSRMFKAEQLPTKLLGKIVIIDHHLSPANFGDVIYQDNSAASVGVLLFRIFKQLSLSMTREVAEALFCSVMSDTGSFRYQNANTEALHTAGELVALGVDPWHIASHLYEDRPRRELELLSKVLQTLELSADGRTAALTVTEQMLSETGCTPDMVDGFINYARGIRGVEVAILLRPAASGVRVSFRSRGSLDVSRVAERFGGGGHRNAAGCFISQELALVRSHIFFEVSRLMTRPS
jgi:bifunctional oligoribonuclease and PAP phosphatase NrnA